MLPIEPGFRVIITVSPVRYAKDGFVENQLSKSILFVALNKLIELYPENIEYFPAYEIIMDELRDYRFYKSDMIRPSQVAVDLVWQYFQKTYFTATDQKVLKEIEAFIALVLIGHYFPIQRSQLNFKILLKRSGAS
ncbi:MAG: GSCFA domain-containing protein [Saprospiraceae bacterium]|nr:GSCFA domain-containing protein [Candidatus Brachybacter algidus]